MKKLTLKQSVCFVLIAILTLSLFMFVGCDDEETEKKVGINEFLTASMITYVEEGKQKVAIDDDAKNIFNKLTNGDTSDNPQIQIISIEFAVTGSGTLKELTFAGATSSFSYYYNDSGIEIPSTIQSEEARLAYLESKAKVEFSTGVLSDGVEIKIANNSNYKSYIYVTFPNGALLTEISGELDMKIVSMAENAVDSLKLMGYGMLAIFIVIAAIMIVVYLLNHFIPANKKQKNVEENEQ